MQVLNTDEIFPAKRFKSNNVINSVAFGFETALYICEQFVGLMVPNKSMIDHSFHAFTEATWHRNRAVISMICSILTMLWNGNDDCFPSSKIQILY